MNSKVFGVGNFKYSKISREERELPWKPNLAKKYPKLHKFQFCARNQGIFHTYSKVYGVDV